MCLLRAIPRLSSCDTSIENPLHFSSSSRIAGSLRQDIKHPPLSMFLILLLAKNLFLSSAEASQGVLIAASLALRACSFFFSRSLPGPSRACDAVKAQVWPARVAARHLEWSRRGPSCRLGDSPTALLPGIWHKIQLCQMHTTSDTPT